MRPLTFFGALGLAEIAVALEVTMVFVALPTLIRIFGDPVKVIWVITAQYLVGASSAALCGRLGDVYGRRHVLLVVMAFTSLGALISAVSSGLEGIIVGRGLQGGIGAAIIPLCFGLVRECMPKDKVAFGIGLVAVIPTMLTGIGLLSGGLLIDHFSWRAIFYVSLVVNLAGLVAVWRYVTRRDKVPVMAKLDWLGGVMFVPPVAGLLYTITQARTMGWGDARIQVLLIACLLALTVWVRYEWRQTDPLINVRLLSIPQIALANICTILFALGAMQQIQVLSLLLQQPAWTGVGLGISGTVMGAILIPGNVITLIGGPVSGRVATVRGGRYTAIAGASMLVLVWCGIALFHANLWATVGLAYFGMLGISVMYAALPNLVIEVAPSDRTSETTGMTSVFRMTFLGIGSQFVGFLLATETITDPLRGPAAFPTEYAYSLTFWVMAGISLICVVVAWLVPRRAQDAKMKSEVAISDAV